MQDLLSQDEIDALLHGVDDVDIDAYDDTDKDGVKIRFGQPGPDRPRAHANTGND